MTLDATQPVAFTVAGDEAATMLSTLDRNRRTFAWKCGGLDAAGTNARLEPSTITLGGLLKHLALVEDHYFTVMLAGGDYPEVWAPSFEADDPDWEWHSAERDSPEELMVLWEGAVARSRAATAAAIAGPDGLGVLCAKPAHWGGTLNLRRLLADLIEEYARHTGHADLIRESVDGLVGEGLPPEG